MQQMRKRIIPQPQRESPPSDTGWLDLQAVARVEVTSEDAAHPIESALLTVGGTGWGAENPRGANDPSSFRTAAKNQAHPSRVSRGEGDAHSTVLAAVVLGSRKFMARYRAPAVSFQPVGATEEIEDYQVELQDAAVLELTIIPNVSGGSYASLTQLRMA